MPIGITPGADGNMWFCAKKANKIGRISVSGRITLFPVPTPSAGPDGTLVGPDGNVWFSEADASQIGCITPEGRITEFKNEITPGARPLSIATRDGVMWFSEAAGNRIGSITLDGHVTELPRTGIRGIILGIFALLLIQGTLIAICAGILSGVNAIATVQQMR